MTFLQFAQLHGLIVSFLIPFKWVRVPTTDHPRSRNGAYKFLETHGYVQNHATQTEVSVWKDEGAVVDVKAMAQRAKSAQQEIERRQRDAAERAEWILSQCALEAHPYLERKGFKDDRGNVWEKDGQRLLVIPMRVGRQIVGVQLIDADGGKKFLTGQRTSGAAFVMDNKGRAVLCEGYATALSIRAALSAIKTRYTLFVCFSAGNLSTVAATLPSGFVVADNDASGTGERVAKEIGWPYFMPPEVGQDFNDYHLATSLFRCSQVLRAAMT